MPEEHDNLTDEDDWRELDEEEAQHERDRDLALGPEVVHIDVEAANPKPNEIETSIPHSSLQPRSGTLTYKLSQSKKVMTKLGHLIVKKRSRYEN